MNITKTVFMLLALLMAAATGYSQQAIHGAAVDVNLADKELFLQKGADVNARNKDGVTPLIAAASTGRLEVVIFLVKKGADVNVKDDTGGTPLIAAAANDHLEVVKFLVEKGANVNARNNNGLTPLIAAAPRGYLEVAAFLVDKGADVNARDKNGLTPLKAATAAVAEFLKEHGAKEQRSASPVP